MVNRTAMLARGLTGQRRMAFGPAATVYVLGRGEDGALEILGTTESASLVTLFGGELELRITETDALDRVALSRAIGVALSTGADAGYLLYTVGGQATPAVGQVARLWKLPIKPNGVPWEAPTDGDVEDAFLLEDGTPFLLEDGSPFLLEEAA